MSGYRVMAYGVDHEDTKRDERYTKPSLEAAECIAWELWELWDPRRVVILAPDGEELECWERGSM